MRARQFTESKNTDKIIVEMFSKFLPLCMKILELDSLPKMVFETSIDNEDQPTFGRYVNDEKTLYVALANRHPNDILRTVAHELVHYKQDTEHQLDHNSGETGSPEENQANSLAGVVMRHFNKQYPEYLKVKPVVLENRFNLISPAAKRLQRSLKKQGLDLSAREKYYSDLNKQFKQQEINDRLSGLLDVRPEHVHKLATERGIKWDNDPEFMKMSKSLTGKAHLDDMNSAELRKILAYINEK